MWVYLLVVVFILYLSHKFESKICFKFLAWAIVLLKNSVNVLDFNYAGMIEESKVNLMLTTHTINQMIFAMIGLLLLPNTKTLRIFLFTCGSLLITGTIYNLDEQIDDY